MKDKWEIKIDNTKAWVPSLFHAIQLIKETYDIEKAEVGFSFTVTKIEKADMAE